jgi:hypothetical protein
LRKLVASPPLHRVRALLAIAVGCAAATLLAGCLSPKYKFARKEAPPARELNIRFPTAPPEAVLGTVITFGGPGSWKREAFWDEYVVTLRNPGDQPLSVVAVTLTDSAGVARPAGDDPWKLERQSKDLEKRYRDAGMAFARAAGPRVMAATAEPAVVTGAGVGSAGAAGAAATTAVALPVYGVAVWGINRHNKAAIAKEFARRKLALPITLGPGETKSGSLFFPMIPNPRSLGLEWSNGPDRGVSVLPLDPLHGIHIKGEDATVPTSSLAPHPRNLPESDAQTS